MSVILLNISDDVFSKGSFILWLWCSVTQLFEVICAIVQMTANIQLLC